MGTGGASLRREAGLDMLQSAQPEVRGSVTVTRGGDVVTVTLANPARLNAISVSMWQGLRAQMERLAADETVRCVVIQGADGNFAAGADIGEFPEVRANAAAVRAYHLDVIKPALHAVRDCPHPIVAAIDGVCVGGGLEIACQCDLRIATASARFGVPINRLGFPMAPDELAGLLALAGRAVTLELLLEGRVCDAHEALQKGLLTRVVADDALAHEIERTTQRIAAGAPLAARLNKHTIARLAPPVPALTAEELDQCFSYCDTTDHAEGIRAFLEKRPPRFRGC